MNLHETFAEFFEEEKLQIFAFLLSKTHAQGGSCLIKGGKYDQLLADSKFEGKRLEWDNICDSPLVGRTSEDGCPFVYTEKRLYLFRYFNYENSIRQNLTKISKEELKIVSKRRQQLDNYKGLIRRFQANISNSNIANNRAVDWSLLACMNAYLRNFSIITGGPGTGKTTTIAKLLALLFSENSAVRIALAAPTGKASKRILESLRDSCLRQPDLFPQALHQFINKADAFTLHRLLGYQPNSPYFYHNADRPLDYDVIIVDEASMIDLPMFSKLLSAIPQNKRLILLGDHHQLSSIDIGVVLDDFCADNINNFDADNLCFFNSFLDNQAPIPNLEDSTCYQPSLMKNRVTGLLHNYRSANYPAIHHISQSILASKLSDIWAYKNKKEAVSIVDYDQVELVLDAYVETIKDYLNCKNINEALQCLNKAKILCAVKEGPVGVHQLNNRVEEKLRAKGLRPNSIFYENRPIIIRKNQPEKQLYNGEIGLIRAGMAYFLNTNNEVICIDPAYIVACETVFALTIHKSQGSEYNSVYIFLPPQKGHRMVRKELLYTAVTRAQQKVCIIANKMVLEQSLAQKTKRASGLKERLYV